MSTIEKKQSSESDNSLISSEKEIYQNLQDVMNQEVEQLAKHNSRRGFMQSLLTGGVFLTVVGSGSIASADICENCILPICLNCLVCCETACQKDKCQTCQSKCIQKCQTSCVMGCEGCLACLQ